MKPVTILAAACVFGMPMIGACSSSNNNNNTSGTGGQNGDSAAGASGGGAAGKGGAAGGGGMAGGGGAAGGGGMAGGGGAAGGGGFGVMDASVDGSRGSPDASTKDGSAPRDAASDASDGGIVTLAKLAAKLTDPQMIRVVSGANSGEIQQGTIAETKAQSGAVREFATMMVRDHTQARTLIANTEKSASLKPAASKLDKMVTEADEIAVAGLKVTPKGALFDRSYMELQVVEHQNVLDMVNAMRSNADAPQLQMLLEQLQTAVQTHLDKAKSILADLG